MITNALLVLYQTYVGPAGLVAGALSGWYGKVAAARMAARRDRLDAGAQALDLVRSMQTREQELQAAITSYSAELEQLRGRRWAMDDMMQELHGQAIAARILVHGLEQRIGLPLSAFEPLRAFPYAPDADPPADAGKVHAAGGGTGVTVKELIITGP